MYAIGTHLMYKIFLPRETLRFPDDAFFEKLIFSPLRVVNGISETKKYVIRCQCDYCQYLVWLVFPQVKQFNAFSPQKDLWEEEIALRIGIVFKKKIAPAISVETQMIENKPLVLFRSFCKEEESIAFHLYVPIDFLSFLTDEMYDSTESIENAIENFLARGNFLFPDVAILIPLLKPIVLENLFARLRQKKLLSIYQIALLCAAFPEHAVKIKHALSKNTVNEVRQMMHAMRADATFGHRDLLEGVYSVEAAIYRLIQLGEKWEYSEFQRELQSLVVSLHMRNVFMQKSFDEWLAFIEEEGLLYQTLVKVNERTIACAFYDEQRLFQKYCSRHFSRRKINDIVKYMECVPAFSEKMSARFEIISAFRMLRIKRKNWGAESFEFVVKNIMGATSMNNFVRETGWFVVSTALKNAKTDIVARVLAPLPNAAKYLIEDVLRGIINPNILHDELQINEARTLCVQKALELYEKGLIDIAM
ncbi:MAG: hypothetical protein N2316_10690 [Spirochaetes bacterium]|nr:hypothetical protein [Spirochaetota bacterium]